MVNKMISILLRLSLPPVLFLNSVICSAQTADMVYVNGRIYTVNEKQPWAQALAIKGDRFAYVGDNKTAKTHIGASTKVIDLQGRMAMPGIHDAHTHLLWAGLQLNYGCQFPDKAGVKQMLSKLKECEKLLKQDEWLVAGLFYASQFPHNKPNKKYLDEVFPDRPIYLQEGTFHHALVNTRALELAGISKGTPDPFGGKLVRDEQGELTGELVEMATTLVTPLLPKNSAQRNLDAVRWAVEKNNEYGITTVQDASGTIETLETLNALDKEGTLTLRVATHLIWGTPKFDGFDRKRQEQLINDRQQYASGHILVDFVKMWIDGSPTPPYFTEAGVENDEVNLQHILIPPKDLNTMVIKLDRMGIKIKMHVAGAGAARVALDAVEAARGANPDSHLRHELGHTNLVTPQDIPRMSQLNVVGDMSPSVWHLYGRQLGKPPQDAWEFKTLLDHGVVMTVGTDWAVTAAPNIFPALEGMLQREEQSIDLVSAIKTMTINGAISLGWEDTSGSIEAGKYADFIVLDRNLFDIPLTDIGETRVLKTVFEGETVYQSRSAKLY